MLESQGIVPGQLWQSGRELFRSTLRLLVSLGHLPYAPILETLRLGTRLPSASTSTVHLIVRSPLIKNAL